MKCLTYSEAEEWLASIDVTIDKHRNLLLPIRPENIMATMPETAGSLSVLAARLADWLSADFPLLFWLSNWETYPPEPFVLFQKIRLGCGESRTLIDAPGHLFDIISEEERAIMTGLIFFIMAHNWEGYIVGKNQKDYIYLGDEHLVFSSATRTKMTELAGLLNYFKLKLITDARQAWK